jgi:3-dehydroquinate synthetase
MPCTFSIDEVLEAMTHNKKNIGGSIRWCLLTEIGAAAYDIEAPAELVKESLGTVS